MNFKVPSGGGSAEFGGKIPNQINKMPDKNAHEVPRLPNGFTFVCLPSIPTRCPKFLAVELRLNRAKSSTNRPKCINVGPRSMFFLINHPALCLPKSINVPLFPKRACPNSNPNVPCLLVFMAAEPKVNRVSNPCNPKIQAYTNVRLKLSPVSAHQIRAYTNALFNCLVLKAKIRQAFMPVVLSAKISLFAYYSEPLSTV